MEDKQIFERWESFKALLRSTNRDGVEEVIQWLDASDFKFAPASTKYHNSLRGGLLDHSLAVYYHMFDFNALLQFFDLPQESIIISSLLHDICKVNCYSVDYRNVKDETGNWIKAPFYKWDESEPIGHAEKSIMLLYELGFKLTKVERAMIRNHMGFARDDAMQVSNLFSKCPQSLVLFFADMTATFITESNDLQDRYKQKLIGRNITEAIQLYMQKLKDKEEASKYIVIDGTKYMLAPQGSIADGTKIIQMANNDGIDVLVYSPYGDGLPI